MNIVMQYHQASDVMTMQQRSPMQGSLPFADCAFRAKGNDSIFFGAGLYACFFKNNLIYIGKYLGKKKDWRSGNIISMRWAKHIGTFTMRARHLGFSDAAYDAIAAYYQQVQTEADNPIRKGFLAADRRVLVRETGCMTTFRRFLVASRIHAETGGEIPLEHFSFLYARVAVSGTTAELRKFVSEAEVKVLQRVYPEGNTFSHDAPSNRIDQSEVSRLLKAALSRSESPPPVSSTPASQGTERALRIIPAEPKPTEPEDTGAEMRFLDQIEAAPKPVQDFVQLLTERVAETPNAEVNYTNNAELRIRSYGVGRRGFRNVITIKWQKGLQRLVMQSLLPASELRIHGLFLDKLTDGITLKHTTCLDVHLLKERSHVIVDAMLRAHELAQVGEI